MISAIIACDIDGGIGRGGTLPWPKISEDLKRFREFTTNSVVIMGRKTWDDPAMPKPLPRRINVIVTSRDDISPYTVPVMGEGIITATGDPEIILRTIQESYRYRNIYVIGGASLFEQCLPYIDRILLTRVQKSFDCDQFINYNEVRQTFTKLASLNTLNIEIDGHLTAVDFMELRRPHATIS